MIPSYQAIFRNTPVPFHCAPTAPLQAVVMLTHGPAGDRELLRGRAWAHHPWVPGRPTGTAALSGTLPSGQLRQGSRCGDLARDTPPLPRNSSTRQGQGRPILAAGPGGPWTHRPGPRRSEETAQAARLAEGRGRNDKPLV